QAPRPGNAGRLGNGWRSNRRSASSIRLRASAICFFSSARSFGSSPGPNPSNSSSRSGNARAFGASFFFAVAFSFPTLSSPATTPPTNNPSATRAAHRPDALLSQLLISALLSRNQPTDEMAPRGREDQRRGFAPVTPFSHISSSPFTASRSP